MFRDLLPRLAGALVAGALAVGCSGAEQRPSEPREVLFEARLRLADMVLGAGIGPSLSEAPGVARRAVLSLASAAAAVAAAPEPSKEPDADGDGVPDARDACPKEPGIKSSDAKTSGCAAKLDAGQTKASAEITFAGFRQLEDGRSQLFVELTDPVAVEVSRVGQVVEYKLVGARVPLRNNRNPLLTRDFPSAALSAALLPDKKAVKLVITLRAPVTPSHRMVARGRGAALEIELPAVK